MSKKIGILCLALAFLLPPSVGMAQQAVCWEPTLESAQRLAAQTNRLVLVYFSGNTCVFCKRMEAEVFAQPAVAAAINTDYVAVKLIADQFPETAKQYGIKFLPTTIVLTPQGQVLDSKQGYVRADEYVARLGQVASDMKHRQGGVYAQAPAAATPPAMNQPMGVPPAATGQYPSPIATPPSYAAQAPQSVAAAPSYGTQAPPVAAAPSYATQAPPPVAAAPSYATQSPPPVAAAPSYATQTPEPVSAAPQSPAGNPTFGLDGFCPVTLGEKQQWVPGDRRIGMTHRGRTYLFIGEEERRRFYADPDRYAPVVSGNDVVLASEQGQAVPGKREHGVFFGNRVYLFSNEDSLKKFAQNPKIYANQALEAMRGGANRGQQLR